MPPKPDPVKKAADNAEIATLRKELKDVEAECVGLRRQVEALLKDIAKAREASPDVDAEVDRIMALRNEHYKGILTRADFRLIQSCVHPDRAPPELRDKYNKASQIFNGLKHVLSIDDITEARRKADQENRQRWDAEDKARAAKARATRERKKAEKAAQQSGGGGAR